MKRSLIICIIGILTSFSINADLADYVEIGFIDGKESDSYLICESPDAEISAAVFVSAEKLAQFAGCRIAGIRAKLQSRLNIDRMELWIRENLDEDNICSVTLTKNSDPELVKGWNEGIFVTPFEIPQNPEKGVFLGITYFQSGASMGISYIEEGCEGAGFIRLPDSEWNDKSEELTLFIEGLVSGSLLPTDCLNFRNVSFSPYFELDNRLFKINGNVRNIGINQVDSFEIRISFEDCEDSYYETFECSLQYGENYDFEIALRPDISATNGTGEVVATITKVNGNDNQARTDFSVAGNYQIVPYAMTKRVLVEEFTTQTCVNCPRVAQWLHEVLENERFKDMVVPICHHSGFGTDSFTIPADEEYLRFYGSNYIYAPAVMIDRTLMTGSTITFNPSSVKELENLIHSASLEPSLISVSINASIVDDEIEVTVRGASAADAEFENPHLVCVVSEDNLYGRQEGADGDYLHQHVERALNSTWGEPLEFLNNEYEYTVSLPLTDVTELENINVVVYVYNYDSSNIYNCKVLNSAILPYKYFTADVDSLIASSEEKWEWYTLSGIHLNRKPTASGIYIKRRGKEAKKIMVN